MSLKEIEKEIENLTPDEQLQLVEKLIIQLRKSNLSSNKKLSWNSLYGLGKDLWQQDAQDYVNELRAERNNL